ncbi:hypothetical protein [Motilimonas sp. KMU-193]|uniref:hypothetical protein n=1 Tax=Motilimonas sp. KMU-193 TaxID=3388668 RepID=UPI00396B3F53
MPSRVELNSIANKIFMFDEVYPYRAAQEQAEKKKTKCLWYICKAKPLESTQGRHGIAR